MTKKHLTLEEAATEFEVSTSCLQNWINQGDLRGVRLRRGLRAWKWGLDPKDIRALMDPGLLELANPQT